MNKITVLLADDHALFREGTRSVIEQETDMEVVGEAGDCPGVIKLAAERSPDVVLMDAAMLQVNGTEAIRRIKTECPGTAVLILTADDNNRHILYLLKAGAAGYLLKNVGGADLVDAIHAVHARGEELNPSAARKIFGRAGANQQQPQDKTQETELSEREMEILRLAAGGMSNQDIAARLYLSHRTVQAHLANIFRKMNAGSRTEAVLQAMRKGWLGLDDLP